MFSHRAVSLWLLYFCYYGAFGSLFPFLPAWLLQRGLAAPEIGGLLTILPVCALITPPIWGAAADAMGSRTGMLIVSALGGAVFVLVLGQTTAPWLMTLLFLGFSFFVAPFGTLADAISHAVLAEKSANFGIYRGAGSLGFALGSWTCGTLFNSPGDHYELWASGILLLACAVAGWALSTPASPISGPIHKHQSHRLVGSVRAVLRDLATALGDRGARCFLLAVGVYYAAHACFDAWLGLYVTALGHDQALVGDLWGLAVGCEVAMMYLAPRLLRGRLKPLLVFCALIAGARWLLLARATTATELLLLQPLHGITFGLWYLCATRWIQARATAEIRAVVQSALSAAIGLGTLCGYFGGGVLMDAHGGSTLFAWAGVLAVIAAALFAGVPGRSSAYGKATT